MASDADDRFQWPDYLFLITTLALSCAVGIYYGVKGRGRQSTEEFLMGNRRLQVIPVSLSLFVSLMSSVALIADPVEIYYHGAIYVFFGVGYTIALPVVAHIFAPVYFRQRLTSIFEYLEMRYNFAVRLAASVCLGTGGMLYLGVALFTPSVAVGQVTGLPVWSCVVIVGFVCMLYTTLGGIKAVIWADALQFLLIVAGLLAVIISGVIQLGGFQNIWNIAAAGHRIDFYKAFNPDPFERLTFWTLSIGGFFRVFNTYISNQIWIQRYCALKSERDVKFSIYLNIPIFLLFLVLVAMCGLILYAAYFNCDPLTARRVTRPDQMIPLLVIDLLKSLPGLSGLYLGGILAASLSSLSSGQSSTATTCFADIIAPFYKLRTGRVLPEVWSAKLAKILLGVMGIVNILVALVIGVTLQKSSTIFQLAMSVVNAFMAPVAGIFVLAVLFPSVDTASTMLGGGIATIISCWLTLGTQISGVRHLRLPTSVAGCDMNPFMNDRRNVSNLIAYDEELINSNVSVHRQDYGNKLVTYSYKESSAYSYNSHDWSVYKFSPILYPVVGPLVCVIVALLITLARRCCAWLMTFRRANVDHFTKKELEHLQEEGQELKMLGEKSTETENRHTTDTRLQCKEKEMHL